MRWNDCLFYLNDSTWVVLEDKLSLQPVMLLKNVEHVFFALHCPGLQNKPRVHTIFDYHLCEKGLTMGGMLFAGDID